MRGDLIMANGGEITVDVNCDICVSKETAEKCLTILCWYLNAHGNEKIAFNKYVDGTASMKLVDISEVAE